ncbi:MAG TPA: PD-(D/E)XK nuclease family protein [Fimbriimonadaceae bacterium]|nr:PD-(D/E)XK nuclease family protein [Fimbriimonadaceae bacterium]
MTDPHSYRPDLLALSELVVNNSQLEQLESLLAEFNVFEAAGMTRDEVKHSRFLAFLLNPREAHGMGDAFLTRLLQRTLQEATHDELPVTPLELELWDLSDTEIRVEWSNIDLLALTHRHKVAVVFENKVGSGEHSDQLNRYFSAVRSWYGEEWRIVPVFLSPLGTPPTDERYIPMTYEFVVEQLDLLLASRASSMSSAVHSAISQYVQLLKRHVVSDSKVKELCQEIYRKHRRALDLIYSYRDSSTSELYEFLVETIREEPRVEFGKDKPGTSEFYPVAWRDWIPRSDETWWNPAGYLFLFWFQNSDKGLRLILEVGPGDREIAQRLLTMAGNNRPLFDPQSKKVGKHWNRIVRMPLVSPATLATEDMDRIRSEFEGNWKRFLDDDLVRMEALLRPECDHNGG